MTKEERKERTNKLLKLHKDNKSFDTFKFLFIPKMFFVPKACNELCVVLFASEIKLLLQQDIYTEAVDINLNPEDKNRTLYKINKLNNISECIKLEAYDYECYAIPSRNLEVIHTYEEETEALEFLDVNTDCPMSEMTIRDLIAILKDKPVSRKQWINDLILIKDG